MVTDKDNELSFGEALTKLEEVVDRLEDEELSLEESLAEFERGIKLSRLCSTTLDQAEAKVEMIVEEEADDLEVQSYNLDEEGAE